MTTLYLICFVLGLALSLLAAFSGFGHIHAGHIHVHAAHMHGTNGATHASPLNGFTLAAFLCWFGGAGYLLDRYSSLVKSMIALASISAGVIGAAIIYVLIFKMLLPRERILTSDDTRMEGTLARVSNEVRALDGIGEILFSQAGTRRSAPARAQDGDLIPRGTEVVVLRYESGIAYVRAIHEFSSTDSTSINL